MRAVLSSLLAILFMSFCHVAYSQTYAANQLLDTTITLYNIKGSTYHGPALNNKLARKTLYDYFKKKGYYTNGYLPDDTYYSYDNNDTLSVEYDTIYYANINGNKYPDAIITYWVAPPFSSGHCIQPYRAIIVDADKGYTIIDEDFIPPNYVIDSIVSVNNRPTIYGYDYECANGKELRPLHIQLHPSGVSRPQNLPAKPMLSVINERWQVDQFGLYLIATAYLYNPTSENIYFINATCSYRNAFVTNNAELSVKNSDMCYKNGVVCYTMPPRTSYPYEVQLYPAKGYTTDAGFRLGFKWVKKDKHDIFLHYHKQMENKKYELIWSNEISLTNPNGEN